MLELSSFAVVLAASLAVGTPAPVSGATETFDKLAYLTFGGPVQVPASRSRPGPTAELTNPETSRNVLQVLSNGGIVPCDVPPSRTSARR